MDGGRGSMDPNNDWLPRSESPSVPVLRTPDDGSTHQSEDLDSVSALATGSRITSPQGRLTRPRSPSPSPSRPTSPSPSQSTSSSPSTHSPSAYSRARNLSFQRRGPDWSETNFPSLLGVLTEDNSEDHAKAQEGSDSISSIESEHRDNEEPLTRRRPVDEQDIKTDAGSAEHVNMRDMGTQTNEVADESSLRTLKQKLYKEKKGLEKSVTVLETTLDAVNDRLAEKEKLAQNLAKEITQHRTRTKELETALEQASRVIDEGEQRHIVAAAKAENDIQESKRIVELAKELRRNTLQLLSNSEKKCARLQDRVKGLQSLNKNLQEGLELQRKVVEDGKRIYEFINGVREHQVKQDLEQLMLYDDLEDQSAVRASRPSQDANQRSSIVPLEPQNMAEMLNYFKDLRRGTFSTLENTPISARFSNFTGLPENPALPMETTKGSSRDQNASPLGTPGGHGEDPMLHSARRNTSEYTESWESSEGTSSSVSYHTKHARRRSSTLVSPLSLSVRKHEKPAATSPEGDATGALVVYSALTAGSTSNTGPSDSQSSLLCGNQPMLISMSPDEILGTTPVNYSPNLPSVPIINPVLPPHVENALEFLEKEDRIMVKDYLKTLVQRNRRLSSQDKNQKTVIEGLRQDTQSKSVTIDKALETGKLLNAKRDRANSPASHDPLPLRKSSTTEQNTKFRPVAKVESTANEDLVDSPTARSKSQITFDSQIKGETRTEPSQKESLKQSLFADLTSRLVKNTLSAFHGDQDVVETRNKYVSPEAPDEKGKSFEKIFRNPGQVINNFYNDSFNDTSNSNNSISNLFDYSNRSTNTDTYYTTHITQAAVSAYEQRNVDSKAWWRGGGLLALCLTLIVYTMSYIPTKSLSVIESDIVNLRTMVMHSATEPADENREAKISKAATVSLLHPTPTRGRTLPDWMTRPQETVYSSVVESVNYFSRGIPGKTMTITQSITVPGIKYETTTITKTQPIAIRETLTETEQITSFDTQKESITMTKTRQITVIENHYKTITLTETQQVTLPQVTQHETTTVTEHCTPTSVISTCPPYPTGGDGDGDGEPNSPGTVGSNSSTSPPLRHVSRLGSVCSTLARSCKEIAWMKPVLGFVLPTKSSKPAEGITPSLVPPLVAPSPPGTGPSPSSSTSPLPSCSPCSPCSCSCSCSSPPPPVPDHASNTQSLRGTRLTPTEKYRAPIPANGTARERTLSEILPAWAVTDPDRYAHIGPSHLGLAPWLRRFCDIVRFNVEELVRRSL